jgi:hypothetical protein
MTIVCYNIYLPRYQEGQMLGLLHRGFDEEPDIFGIPEYMAVRQPNLAGGDATVERTLPTRATQLINP